MNGSGWVFGNTITARRPSIPNGGSRNLENTSLSWDWMRRPICGCVRSYKRLQRGLFFGPFVVDDTKNHGVLPLPVGPGAVFAKHALEGATDLLYGAL